MGKTKQAMKDLLRGFGASMTTGVMLFIGYFIGRWSISYGG